LFVQLVACTSGDYRTGPPPPTTTTTLAPEVTLRGVVGAFSASARIITLATPVGDVTNVVVPTDAEVVKVGGTPASVADLVPKSGVEIIGRPGSAPGTLIARRVTLL
jgi:hypothetical protein